MINNISDLAPYLADEHKARELFEQLRWPEGPVCPRCNQSDRVYKLEGKSTRPGVYKCGHCRKPFTVTVGTVFEGSHIKLGHWLYALTRMCTSKKGISAKQLERELDISYKSAWFMCHRVRYAMSEPPLLGKLQGVVEVDETYIGGKPRNNKHKGYKPKKKPIVVALIERDGKARSFLMPSARRGTLQNLVRLNVAETAHLITDQYKPYRGLDKHLAKHSTINHSKQYVRGIIHTNFAESYFSLLKRGVFGTFHHISRKHAPRYLREFEFRWNRRKAANAEMLVDVVRMAKGKRLVYREPTSRDRH